MILTLPKVGPVRFRDDITDEEFKSQLEALSKKYEFEIPRAELTTGEMASRAFERGKKRLGTTFGDIIPAMAGQALGFEDYAKRQMEEAAATEEEIATYYAPQYKSYKDIGGPGDLFGYGLETVIEQVPNIATSLIPGVGAGAIAARAGVGAAAQTAAVGAGTFLGSYAQSAPEIFQNIYQETGKMEVPTALMFGSVSAALDSVLPATLARQLTGPMRIGVVEKLLEKSGMDKGVLRGTTAGIFAGAGTEGLTEGAQESISIAAERFIDENPEVFGSKEWERIIESSIRGSVAGSAFGGAGGGIESMRAGAERKRQMADALERRGQRQEAARLRKEVAAAEAEIEQIQLANPQMQLPGMDTGVYTSLIQPQSVAAKAAKDAKDSLTGKQLSLFDERGNLTQAAEKAATKDQKATANRAREEAKRQAADLKKYQEQLKKYLAAKQTTLPGFSKEEIDTLQAQEAARAAEAEATGQGDLFTGMPPSAAPATTEAAVTPPTAPSTAIGSDKNALKTFGKQFGIGPTAKILKEDGPLAGKDISKPEDAAEVKRVLEAYASGKPAEGAAAKIEEYLKRPEFQTTEETPATAAPTEVTPSEPTTGFIAGAGEPSVPTTVPTEVISADTERTGEPVTGELETVEPTVERADVGEGAVKPTLEIVQEADRRATNFIKQAAADELAEVGIDPADVNLEDFVNTDAYNYIRLPQLVNEFFRLKDVLAIPDEQVSKKDRAKRKKDKEDFASLEQVIKDIGGAEFFTALNTVPAGRREAIFSEMNREAKAQILDTVQADPEFRERLEDRKRRAAEVRPGKTSFERKPPKRKAGKTAEVTDEELDAFNQAYFEKTGETLFLPEHRGPDLNDAGRALVEAGNLKGVIDNLKAGTDNKDVQRILAKIKSLNLKTKIQLGAVEGNKAGSYDPRTDTITINPDVGMNEHTVLHELVHAAISHVLNNRNLPLSKEFGNFFEQIRNQLGDAYGGENLQEFAAELVSNPEFQALLKTIKAPKSESLFKRIMQTLAEFFGFSKGTNSYKRGIELVSRAVDMSADVPPTPSDLLFLSTPNGMRRGFKGVGMMGQAMPSLTGRLVENTRNYISNMPGDVKSIAMGLLRLDNINEIYGAQLPSLQKLIDALEQRNGTQEQRIQQINENYKRFTKVAQKHPQAMERMNDMAYDARLAQVDPIDPNFKPSPAQVAEYNKLKQIYDSLPKDVQQVYKDIRKSYNDAINEYEDILLNSVQDPSIRQKLRAQYEARKRQIAYIPFLRQGDFWVEYDENGERAVQAFQSERERATFISTQLKNKPHKAYRNINEAQFTQGSLPPGSFIVGVMNQLNKQGASDALKNSVYQSYLALFPAESLAKNFMKADNVRGMERDIVRGYGETMIKWARKLSASKYNPEIDKALRGVALEGEAAETAEAGSGAYTAAQNVVDQAAFFHNPTYGSLVSAATTFSYFNYIAGNISSALVNLTTVPMFSWSILGAKFGFDKASGALFNSSKVAINYIFNNKVPPKYQKLFDELSNHAQLEHTLAREVLEGRRETTSEFTGLKARIMDGLSIPFAKTEVLNRGATAIAAYDLAKASGMKDDDAIRYAINTTKQINTSGLSATAPRYMQHPAGRVFFTFKSFIWNSAFVVARAFHQAFKGETPAIQREARRQLLGIYGMTMAFAGIKGLPFMGAVSTLSTMISSLFGDEDEPFDLDVELRDFFGDLLYKGGVNYATNLEIANRVGVANDLLFRDDPRSVAEHGYVLTAMSQMFGPVGSFAIGAGRGAELIAQGEVVRGIESIVPSFIRNGMKGMRYMSEGALNLKGEPIIEDVSAYNALMQMIGFGPADLSAAYEKVSMKKEYERDVLTRRSQLLNKYDMARRAGDYDLMQEVQADIESFNEARKDPAARITPETLDRSQRAREAYEQNTINGVRFNKSLMPEIEDLLEE
jgi:hypothetical protein